MLLSRMALLNGLEDANEALLAVKDETENGSAVIVL
jgi:hypothetical protein